MKSALALFGILPWLLVATANAQPTRVDTTFVMDDGVSIAASLFLPDGTAPPGGFPAIISSHGVGGSRRSNAPRALRYADSGYVTLTYSVRGQGRGAAPADESGGLTNWVDDARLIQDIRELVRVLGSRSDVNAARIGLEGFSQGGRITWAALMEDVPVVCGLPVIATPYNAGTFARHGVLNYFMAWALLTARTGNLVAFGPMFDSVYSAYERADYADVIQLTESTDRSDRIHQINVPVLSILAWQDELFPVAPMLRGFSDFDFPAKLLLLPGGHGDLRMPELADGLALRFFRRWLRDDTAETVMDPDSAVLMVDPATLAVHPLASAAVELLLPGGARTDSIDLRFHAGGRLLQEQPVSPISVSRFYLQNITDESVVFRSEPVDEDVDMMGGRLFFTGSSDAPVWQTNVLLFDYDPDAGTWRPITRGAWGAQDGGAARDVEYDLDLTRYRLRAGHVLEARIRFGLPVILPQAEFGWAPTPPAASGTTRFAGTADRPATLRLYTIKASATGVERTASEADRIDIR